MQILVTRGQHFRNESENLRWENPFEEYRPPFLLPMSQTSFNMRRLATRLIAYETRGNKSSETESKVAFLVCEKLRPHLATLVGNTGFRALLSRSLALANAEVQWLRAVQVKADGSLESPEELHVQVEPKEILEGQVVLVAQLLGLLVAFIGENLTVRLVREIWPKVEFNYLESGTGSENEKTK